MLQNPNLEGKVEKQYMEIPAFEGIRITERGHEIIGKKILHEMGPYAAQAEYPHPITLIVLENKEGKLLFQMRSKNVVNPHVLDFSAAGHVEYGDTLEETMLKEAKEEVGAILKKEEVTLITENPIIKDPGNPPHLIYVFHGKYDGPIEPKDGEVDIEGTRYYSIDEIRDLSRQGKIKPVIKDYFKKRRGIEI